MTKQAACVVFISDDGQKVLGVSRFETSDWGYPGGRMVPEDQGRFEDCAVRCVESETGFVLSKEELVPVFARKANRCFTMTYVVEKSKIPDNHPFKKPGLAWKRPEDLEEGSFGDYNRALLEELRRRGWLHKPGLQVAKILPAIKPLTPEELAQVEHETRMMMLARKRGC